MEAILQLQPHLDIKSISYLSPKPIIFLHQNFLSLTRSRVTMCSSSSPTPSFSIGKYQTDTSERKQGLWLSTWSGKMKSSMLRWEDTRVRKKMLFFLNTYPSQCFHICNTHRFWISIFYHVLHDYAHSININNEIWSMYFNEIVPELVKAGNNDECGSIAVCTLFAYSMYYNTSAPLQALSKTIHYGKFVVEAMFQDAPSQYEAAIKAKDRKLLLEFLTYESVEAIMKKRVELKAKTFGQVVMIDEADNVAKPTYKIKPSLIANLFENRIMPLTKEVQVEYLLKRFG
ncbi:chorismate mutase [Vigna unguiculata]|uniref:chorismate mutase n=1 Tax=Vigna unguiculata TaxID=3917 RepID=A0A4D6LPA5_VIGUN|nr:chorismate mutase [Vigna unguiculata]